MTRCSACVENLLESSQLACGWSPDDEACAARTTGRRVARQPRSMTRETTEQDMAVLQYGGRIVGAKKGGADRPYDMVQPVRGRGRTEFGVRPRTISAARRKRAPGAHATSVPF